VKKRRERGDFGFFEYTVNIYTVRIPFTGEAIVFSFSPNLTDFNPPRATLDGQEVMMVVEQKQPDATALRNAVEKTTASIQKYLSWLTEMVAPFNAQLIDLARECIKRRKEKVGRDVDVLTAVGIPIRQRSGLPSTVAVPVQRVSIPLPKPEPRHFS
jgi:hypothetical protein